MNVPFQRIPIRRRLRQLAAVAACWALLLFVAFVALRPLQAGDDPAASPSPKSPSPKSASTTDAAAKKLLQNERDKLHKRAVRLLEKRKMAEATAAGKQVLDLSRKIDGDTSEIVAADLDWLAYRQVEVDDFESALRTFEEALSIHIKLHGEADYRTADVRRHVEEARLRSHLGPPDRQELVEADFAAHWAAEPATDPAKAVEFAERAYAARRKLLGLEHPMTAQSLRRLGQNYTQLKQYAKAEPCLQDSVRIRLKILGDRHPDTASSLETLATLKDRQHEYGQAADLCKRALEIRAKVRGEETARVAAQWQKIARLYNQQPNYEQAALACRRAIAIREKVLGAEDRRTAESLHLLGTVDYRLGRLAESKAVLTRALGIRRNKLGNTHRETVETLISLGMTEQLLGNQLNAELHYREALDTQRKTAGEQDLTTASAYSHLGEFYTETADYTKAEPLLQRALEIERGLFGENHVQTASGMSQLARLYGFLGDTAKAESLYQKALEIERTARPGGLRCAQLMERMSSLYVRRGDLRRAEQLCRDAIAIKRRLLREDNAELHSSLEWLASVQIAKKEYDQARATLEPILEIEQKSLGEDHPFIAALLDQLALIQHAMNDDAKAALLYTRALAIRKKQYRGDQPQTAISLYDVGATLHFLGENAQAEPKLREALDMCQRMLWETFGILAERQQLLLEQKRRRLLDVYLSTTDELHSPAADVYRFVLAGKGAVTANQSLARLERRRPELAPLADELLQVGTRLAHLSFAVPAPAQRGDWLKEISELTERKDRLERDLAARSAPFREARQTQRADPSELRKALPPHVALIDILYYTHSFSLRPGEKTRRRSEERYVAFVVRRDAQVERVELGPAAPIVRRFNQWRQKYGARQAGPDIAQELSDRVWKPLEPYLNGAETVLVSPDGAFCWFPLGALPGARPNSYLIEERNIVFVPVPQLLLRPGSNAAPRPDDKGFEVPLLLGNVDFDADPGAVSLAAHDAAEWSARGRLAARGADPAQATFNPLPGTADEIDDIADIYRRTFHGREPVKLTGGGAKEQTVRTEAPKHRWIHLATHGFFAPAAVLSAGKRQRGGERVPGRLIDSVEEIRGVHPSLLSGVALAGANRRWPSAPRAAGKSDKELDDGILTALDVEGLNLADVDLVVLSACETGLGQVAGGEGMLGLQRAFQVAGAQNVVASLWKVNDVATAVLMRLFYENLWIKKQSPPVALREAQLTLLHNPDLCDAAFESRGPNFDKVVKLVESKRPPRAAPTASPRLWAAFVLSQSTLSAAEDVRH